MTLGCRILNKRGHFFFSLFVKKVIFVIHRERTLTHLVMRSLAIFGQSRVMSVEQGYELRTLHCLANQNDGNPITEEYSSFF